MKPPQIDDPHFMRQLARLVKAAEASIGGPVLIAWTHDPTAVDPEARWSVEVWRRPNTREGLVGPYVTDSGIGAVVLAAQDFEKHR